MYHGSSKDDHDDVVALSFPRPKRKCGVDVKRGTTRAI
jgi:hypothetical protein